MFIIIYYFYLFFDQIRNDLLSTCRSKETLFSQTNVVVTRSDSIENSLPIITAI